MKTSDFDRKYKISDALPAETERHVFSISEFSDAIFDFFNTEFEGLVRVVTQKETEGFINISEEYLAHFFKTLLRLLYGSRLLNISISKSSGELSMLTTSEGGILLSKRDVGILYNDARDAGFEIERVPDGFELTTAIIPRSDFALHAIFPSSTFLLTKLRKIFFE